MSNPVKEKEDSNDQTRLKNEYDLLCEDWRHRDRHVLEKLIPSSILFASAIIGFVELRDVPTIMPILFFFCLLFSVVLAMSTLKDMYYNWGTQQAIEALAARLNIQQALSWLPFARKHKGKNSFEFPRKIKFPKDDFAKEVFSLPPVRFLVRISLKAETFELIALFQLLVCLGFLALLIMSIYNACCP